MSLITLVCLRLTLSEGVFINFSGLMTDVTTRGLPDEPLTSKMFFSVKHLSNINLVKMGLNMRLGLKLERNIWLKMELVLKITVGKLFLIP